MATQDSNIPPEPSTAYHEAGHAVMAWYFGNTITSMTIVPDYDQGYAGFMKHDGDGCAEGSELGGDVKHFTLHPDHGLVVEMLDGKLRLPTDAEQEHCALSDEITELNEPDLMIAAAGEAAHKIFEPDTFHQHGSSSDRQEALDAFDVEPLTDSQWNEWVEKTAAFLQKPTAWHRVNRLAAALIQHHTLDTQAVLTAIRGDS